MEEQVEEELKSNVSVYFSRKNFKELREASNLRSYQIFGVYQPVSFSKYLQYLVIQDLIKSGMFRVVKGFNLLDSKPVPEEIIKQKAEIEAKRKEWDIP